MSERWHVLGVGAIGGLFACRLQSGGADVTLLTKKGEQPSRELILKSGQEQRFQFPQQNLAIGQEPIEYLLVCTKAWAVESAIEAIAPRLSATSVVVLLCNGMGLAEAVAPLIGEAQLVVGSTTSGCRRSKQGELIVSGEGRTQLGSLDASLAPTWLSPWHRGVPDFEWETDIRSVLLAKFGGMPYLLVGMGDGVLLTFSFDSTSGALSGRKNSSLGTQPVTLSPFHNHRRHTFHIFAASDRPAVISSEPYNARKMLFSNVNV